MCCSVLQCVLVYCSVSRTLSFIVHWVASRQCAAMCCSVLQCVLVYCSVSRTLSFMVHWVASRQCVAMCCSVSQCVLVYCSVSRTLSFIVHWVASRFVWRPTYGHVIGLMILNATYCNTLQHAATRCNTTVLFMSTSVVCQRSCARVRETLQLSTKHCNTQPNTATHATTTVQAHRKTHAIACESSWVPATHNKTLQHATTRMCT